jgi:hypothetical protein
MRKLAQLVAKRAVIRVEADYSAQGRATTWYLQWGDGPSVDVVRRHVQAVAKSVDGLDFAEVGYRRNYTDRHMVAAWLLQSDLENEYADVTWAAQRYFDQTSFPADIADDDPLWDLVDYAFDLCGGPGAYADRVIQHVAGIGLRGLRMEHWLDQIDTADPAAAARHLVPLLAVSGLSERTQESLRAVTAAIVRDLAGNGPRQADPRVRVLAAEAARAALTQPLDDQQRRIAVQCVADGTALYKLSRWIGKSDSTLVKRWSTDEFNRDLAPVAWIRQHQDEWARTFLAAVAELEANADLIRHNRDVRQLLHSVKAVLDREGTGWQRLLGSPETARTLLAIVEEDRSALLRDRKKYRPVDEALDSALDPGPALRRLTDLLAEYDAARPPRRRGGSHPRHTSHPE